MRSLQLLPQPVHRHGSPKEMLTTTCLWALLSHSNRWQMHLASPPPGPPASPSPCAARGLHPGGSQRSSLLGDTASTWCWDDQGREQGGRVGRQVHTREQLTTASQRLAENRLLDQWKLIFLWKTNPWEVLGPPSGSKSPSRAVSLDSS